jgi:hypothetical protein
MTWVILFIVLFAAFSASKGDFEAFFTIVGWLVGIVVMIGLITFGFLYAYKELVVGIWRAIAGE